MFDTKVVHLSSLFTKVFKLGIGSGRFGSEYLIENFLIVKVLVGSHRLLHGP